MIFRFLVYNKFKSRKWSRLSYAQRLKACQSLERIEAKKQRRFEYQIIIKDMDEQGYAGLCRSQQQQMLLDDNYIKEEDRRFYLMYTIFHEGRHAYQHRKIDGKEKHSIFSKAYRWKKNSEGYINYTKDMDSQSYYDMQPMELDANEYALKRLKSFRFRFTNDPDYIQTVQYYEDRAVKREERAKKELGFFYKIKVALRSRKKRKEKHKK